MNLFVRKVNKIKEDDNNNDDILTKKESTVEVLDPVFQF